VAQQLIAAHGDKAVYQAGVRAAEFVKTGEFVSVSGRILR
jgi:hypothetical protein